MGQRSKYTNWGLSFYSDNAVDAMWDDAPHPAIVPFSLGYGEFDDFLRWSEDEWTINVVSSGTGTSTVALKDAAGGIVRVNCAADENDGGQAQLDATTITLTTSNYAWMDWRVNLTDEATQSDAFVGLAADDTSIIAGAPDNRVLWHKDDGDTNWDFTSDDGGSTTNSNALATAVAGTAVVLGFSWNGTTLTPYIDGIAQNSDTITTNIPTGTGMKLSFGYLNGDGTAQHEGMDLDWMRYVVISDRS